MAAIRLFKFSVPDRFIFIESFSPSLYLAMITEVVLNTYTIFLWRSSRNWIFEQLVLSLWGVSVLSPAVLALLVADHCILVKPHQELCREIVCEKLDVNDWCGMLDGLMVQVAGIIKQTTNLQYLIYHVKYLNAIEAEVEPCVLMLH